MEEDINKLQKFIDNCKNCKFATCEQCEINWTEVKAIQNLIARYKELEEKCKKKNKTIETMQFIESTIRGQENTILMTEEQCAVKNKYMIEVSNGEFVDVNELYSIWKNSIPKSKVKEKIEELNNEFNERNSKEEDFNYNYGEEYAFAEEKLKELLED